MRTRSLCHTSNGRGSTPSVRLLLSYALCLSISKTTAVTWWACWMRDTCVAFKNESAVPGVVTSACTRAFFHAAAVLDPVLVQQVQFSSEHNHQLFLAVRRWPFQLEFLSNCIQWPIAGENRHLYGIEKAYSLAYNTDGIPYHGGRVCFFLKQW